MRKKINEGRGKGKGWVGKGREGKGERRKDERVGEAARAFETYT